MQYFPLTDADRREMAACIGIGDVRELFSDIPGDAAYYALDALPESLPENRLIKRFEKWADKNHYAEYLSFLGAGAHDHFIPEVVNQLSMRGEFLTPYTPYQPEVSQGSLQAMFEYQTMICMLTGMDVSNSSLYDGGTAAAEALLMMTRKSRKHKVLVSEALHPEYREIIHTVIQNLDIQVQTIPVDRQSGVTSLDELRKAIDADTAGMIFQSPNFFGVVENGKTISELCQGQNILCTQVVAEAMSLPFLSTPGEAGVDICVGEAQSFGLPLSFGGPYLGFMAVKNDFLRQMPGRLVGQTMDQQGRRGYVLTLSTREQHIKREKATSNICSNQAWCALRAGMYLATMGRKGLQDIAEQNHRNAAYFVSSVTGLSQVEVVYPRNFFNEVLLRFKKTNAADAQAKLRSAGILAGLPLGWFFPELNDCVLLSFSELHDRSDIDRLVAALGGL